jgi:ankyrin repeat protein
MSSKPIHKNENKNYHTIIECLDDPEALQKLLDNGADVNATDRVMRTPLIYAVQHHKLKTIKQLIQHGADLNAPGFGILSSALHQLCYLPITDTDIQIIELLLDNGADIDIEDSLCTTPLQHLILQEEECDSIQAIELLLKRGADHTRALNLAVDTDQKNIVRLLLKYNADTYEKNKDGYSSLQLAKNKEMIDIIVNHRQKK